MQITSSAFQDQGMMPAKYGYQNENLSPPLHISNIPEKTKSLVLIVDDPDAPAGNWDHWILWNISPVTSIIAEGVVPKGVRGKNDFNRLGYDGPSPPSGTHRYFFKVYALDTILNLSEGSRKGELEKAMKNHILEKAVLVGKYSR